MPADIYDRISYLTINGEPAALYGFIGVTTLLLAYMTFMGPGMAVEGEENEEAAKKEAEEAEKADKEAEKEAEKTEEEKAEAEAEEQREKEAEEKKIEEAEKADAAYAKADQDEVNMMMSPPIESEDLEKKAAESAKALIGEGASEEAEKKADGGRRRRKSKKQRGRGRTGHRKSKGRRGSKRHH